jgi:hypothetical protein
MPRGCDLRHAIRALPGRPMRVFTPIIAGATLTLFHPGQELTLRRAVALERIGDDDAGHIGEALEQLAKELLRCRLVPSTLDEDVQDEGVSHVLDLSEGSSKLIPIHEEPNHQIVHLFRLGKANRTTH